MGGVETHDIAYHVLSLSTEIVPKTVMHLFCLHVVSPFVGSAAAGDLIPTLFLFSWYSLQDEHVAHMKSEIASVVPHIIAVDHHEKVPKKIRFTAADHSQTKPFAQAFTALHALNGMVAHQWITQTKSPNDVSLLMKNLVGRVACTGHSISAINLDNCCSDRESYQQQCVSHLPPLFPSDQTSTDKHGSYVPSIHLDVAHFLARTKGFLNPQSSFLREFQKGLSATCFEAIPPHEIPADVAIRLTQAKRKNLKNLQIRRLKSKDTLERDIRAHFSMYLNVRPPCLFLCACAELITTVFV